MNIYTNHCTLFLPPSTHTMYTRLNSMYVCTYIKCLSMCSRNDNGLIQVSFNTPSFYIFEFWATLQGPTPCAVFR